MTDATMAVPKQLSGKEPPFALLENAMLYLVPKSSPKWLDLPFTVHGFRSSFRDSAAETTDHANEVVEMARAHGIRSKPETA